MTNEDTFMFIQPHQILINFNETNVRLTAKQARWLRIRNDLYFKYKNNGDAISLCICVYL